MLRDDPPRLADRAVGLVAGVAIVLVLGLALVGGQTAAITTDEPAHVDMYNTFLESGWYTTKPPTDDAAAISDSNSYVLVYGPLVHDLAHRVSVGLGIEKAGLATLDSGAQVARRAVLAAMLALGALGMAWLGKVATKRWSWGLLVGAFFVSMPVLSGSAMFNVKDLPVAMGLTLLVSGLVVSVTPSSARLRYTGGLSALAIAAGWLMALGSRPALALVLLGVITLAVVITAVIVTRGKDLIDLAQARSAAVSLLAGTALGYGLLLLLYPKLFSQPGAILLGSFSSASTFGWGGWTLMAGEQVSSQPGWSYIPLWVGVQIPLFLLFASCLGIAVVVVAWAMFLRTGGLPQYVNVTLLLGATVWSAITIGIPVGLIPTEPYLYNGLRQVLFLLPGVAFLALFGTWWLWNETRERDLRTASVLVLIAATLGGIVIPAVGQLRLFPYGYAGMNSLAALGGIDGRWETDYWGASTGELTATAIDAREVGLLPEYFSYPPDYCDEAGYSGRWKQARGTSPAPLDGETVYYCQVRTWGRNTPPEGCEVGWSVKRPQLWRESTMSLIAKCQFIGGPVPGGGINFAVEAKDGVLQSAAEPVLLWGWQLSPDLGVYSNSSSVGLGIDVPTDFRMRDLEAEFDLKVDLPDEEPLSVMIRVNGEPLGAAEFDEQSKEQNLRFTIPAQVVDRSENDLLIIRIDEMNGTEAPMFLFPRELTLTAV